MCNKTVSLCGRIIHEIQPWGAGMWNAAQNSCQSPNCPSLYYLIIFCNKSVVWSGTCSTLEQLNVIWIFLTILLQRNAEENDWYFAETSCLKNCIQPYLRYTCRLQPKSCRPECERVMHTSFLFLFRKAIPLITAIVSATFSILESVRKLGNMFSQTKY